MSLPVILRPSEARRGWFRRRRNGTGRLKSRLPPPPPSGSKKVALREPSARNYVLRMADAVEIETAPRIGFEEILREHESMVFSIAYHFLRDRAAAEELAQDVFLQLYRNLDSLESPEHATRWLRRVATNRCIDFCRRRRLAPQVGLDEVREPAAPAAARDPMLSRALVQLVASLPEKWRALIVLKYQEDMDNEEIAATLEMPVGTVKSQLSRALDLLREKASRVLGERQ